MNKLDIDFLDTIQAFQDAPPYGRILGGLKIDPEQNSFCGTKELPHIGSAWHIPELSHTFIVEDCRPLTLISLDEDDRSRMVTVDGDNSLPESARWVRQEPEHVIECAKMIAKLGFSEGRVESLLHDHRSFIQSIFAIWILNDLQSGVCWYVDQLRPHCERFQDANRYDAIVRECWQEITVLIQSYRSNEKHE